MSTVPPLICQTSWPALPSTTAAQSQTPSKTLSVTQAATSSQIFTQSQPHSVFIIPELLAGVLFALPLEDLRNCYRVSPWWRQVIHAHMPPEKIPLPGDVDISDKRSGRPTRAPSGPVLIHSALLGWEDQKWPASWQCNAAGQPTLGTFSLEMFYHGYLALLDDHEIDRNAYIAYPPPSSVELHFHDFVRLRARDWNTRQYWRHTDRSGRDFLRVEREGGVRLRDVFDYVKGLVYLVDYTGEEEWEQWLSDNFDLHRVPKEHIAAWEYFGVDTMDMHPHWNRFPMCKRSGLLEAFQPGSVFFNSASMSTDETVKLQLELVFNWDAPTPQCDDSADTSDKDQHWSSGEHSYEVWYLETGECTWCFRPGRNCIH